MKRHVAWVAAVWIVAAAASAGEVVKDDWGWPAAMKAVTAAYKGAQGKVVPIGDSITYANPAGQWARYGKGRTPEEVAICKWMRSDVNDKSNGWWLAANDQPSGRSWTAASGMTAAQCLAGGHHGLPALDAILADHDPQIAIVLLGTNDAGKKVPAEQYLKSMETIYEKCLKRGTIPVVTTVPPRNPDPAGLIGAYNAGLVALAKKHGLPLVDYHGEILARQPGDAWMGTLISKDGVHPSNEGSPGPATPENLAKCGYLLRCWLNVHKVMEIKQKVLDAAAGGGQPAAKPAVKPAAAVDKAAPPVAARSAPVPGFVRQAPPLPPPAGDVVRVATVAELIAAANALKTGQTILVAPGVYAMPQLLPIQNADDVAIRGAGGDRSKVVLDFAGSRHTEGVVFTNCKRAMLADLTVQNVKQNGIKLNGDKGAAHVTIRNVHSRNVWQRHVKGPQLRPGPDGTHDWAPGHRIEFCLFENDRPKQRGDEPYEDENPDKFKFNYIGGIDVMSTDGLVIADNVFRNIHGNTNEGRGCVFIWVGSKNAVVERNLCIDCDQGICLGNPSRGNEGLVHATDCVVRNNVVVRCPDNDLFAAHSKGCRFVHNTVFDPASKMKRLFRAVSTNEGLEVAGNIFSGPEIPAEFTAGVAFHDNLNRDLAGYFRAPAQGDLRLVAAAVDAIDRGPEPALVTDDVEAQPRRGRPDLGADELD
jgi:lysophospholipase L1-like esterase